MTKTQAIRQARDESFMTSGCGRQWILTTYEHDLQIWSDWFYSTHSQVAGQMRDWRIQRALELLGYDHDAIYGVIFQDSCGRWEDQVTAAIERIKQQKDRI